MSHSSDEDDELSELLLLELSSSFPSSITDISPWFPLLSYLKGSSGFGCNDLSPPAFSHSFSSSSY